MIGIPVNQTRINDTVGAICRQFGVAFRDVAALKAWSDLTSQDAIVALGFSVDDAYLVKLIIEDLNQLRLVYEGQATLGVAKDFRVQPQKAVGLGV